MGAPLYYFATSPFKMVFDGNVAPHRFITLIYGTRLSFPRMPATKGRSIFGDCGPSIIVNPFSTIRLIFEPSAGRVGAGDLAPSSLWCGQQLTLPSAFQSQYDNLRRSNRAANDFLLLLAETLNTKTDDVAMLQELRWLHPHAHAGWCARRDDVARLKRHEVGDV